MTQDRHNPSPSAHSNTARLYACTTPGCSEAGRGATDEPTFCSVCLCDLTAFPEPGEVYERRNGSRVRVQGYTKIDNPPWIKIREMTAPYERGSYPLDPFVNGAFRRVDALGPELVFKVCTVCNSTINAGGLCSYGCPEDATPHRGTERVVVYAPKAELR